MMIGHLHVTGLRQQQRAPENSSSVIEIIGGIGGAV